MKTPFFLLNLFSFVELQEISVEGKMQKSCAFSCYKPAGKIAEKAVWMSVLLTMWHCILNADSTKTHPSSVTFWWFCRLGSTTYSRISTTETIDEKSVCLIEMSDLKRFSCESLTWNLFQGIQWIVSAYTIEMTREISHCTCATFIIIQKSFERFSGILTSIIAEKKAVWRSVFVWT